ncbi:MAG: metal ABC transporter permease, partial [bacterium]|nr:metal ABC transporter permease [bacterium]
METSLSHALLIAVAVGLASGAIGSFIILRRMALVGDALSHVALPGIALALAWSIDPFWGVVVFLAVAAVVVWWLQGRTKLPGEAIVGLLFTASLAVGILALPSEDLIDSLFGAFPALTTLGLWLIVLGAILLTAATFWLARKFLFMIVSPDLAHVNGISSKTDLALLLIFALVVALGIKLVGTLLMGALTIIPAL